MIDIEALARQAGATQYLIGHSYTPGPLTLQSKAIARFAALVAEECARLCDAEQQSASVCVGRLAGAATAMETARVLAAAIRAAFPAPNGRQGVADSSPTT